MSSSHEETEDHEGESHGESQGGTMDSEQFLQDLSSLFAAAGPSLLTTLGHGDDEYDGHDEHDEHVHRDEDEDGHDEDVFYHDIGDDDYVDEDDEFFDAQGGDIALEVVIEQVPAEGSGGADNEDGEGGAAADPSPLQTRILRLIGGRTGPGWMAHRQMLALLRGYDPGIIYDDDDDDFDDGLGDVFGFRRTRRNPPDPNRFPKVPSDDGRKLMESGQFGAFDIRDRRSKGLSRRLLDRELGLGDKAARKINQGLMAQQMIPSTNPEMIIHYDEPVCCGQFSDDGNFFYACVKDFKVRMYDTSNPYNWRLYKTVNYPFGQWTLTDADLSPDNRWLAYSSLVSRVCFTPTDPNDTGDPYSLDLGSNAHNAGWGHHSRFAIFSIRFSGDGRHLVAGTGADSIVVYDIERREALHNVVGHVDDVNAVCFADKMSPHILYSGSDDCTIKVWDTRSMGDGREAGAFVGHIEGLTYIDSKGDGRYVLSNGKDQSMKLWDLRMAMSTARYQELDPTAVTRRRAHEYDYRMGDYDDYRWFQHPHDNSLVTFRGHKIQRTLIRCHFSPPDSTDSRYVYSGSQDGFVYIWNLDATLAGKIDVKTATKDTVPVLDRRYRVHLRNRENWSTLVRDVGWHPHAPILVASSWNGPIMNSGTASIHSWNDNDTDEADPPMGRSVNEKLEVSEMEEESWR